MKKNIKDKILQKIKQITNKRNIIWIILALLMFIPITIEIINNNRSLDISYQEFETIIEDGNPAIIYFDSKVSPVRETILKNLKKVAKESEVLINNIDYEILTDEQKTEVTKLNLKIFDGPAFAFIDKGVVFAVRNGAFSEAELVILYNRYFSGDGEDVNYKVAGSAEKFDDVIKEDKITLAVFSATSCSYCQKYKPVINDLATKYNIDIYNFDFEVYDALEFEQVLAKAYTVPAQSQSIIGNNNEKMVCTITGKDSPVKDEYYRTPLSVFFKDGKVIDCISGYVDSETLESVFVYHKISKIITE